jgi:hypothetical protein
MNSGCDGTAEPSSTGGSTWRGLAALTHTHLPLEAGPAPGISNPVIS